MSMQSVLSQLLSGRAGAGLAGALAGGLIASKSGRKLGKSALELGGVAAIAGLAYAAWRTHQRGVAHAPPLEREAPMERHALRAAGFLPAPHAIEGEELLARDLLRAMLAAARADGKLDAAESRVLSEHVLRADLGDAERAALYAELEKPVSLDEVAAAATTPQRAIELYTASLLAIEVDSAAERGYLALLAARLGLDADLVSSIHREMTRAPNAPDAVRPV